MAQEERPADVVRFRTSVARRKLAELLLERERFELSAKSGGGILSYEVWGFVEKDKTVVTRYNLAYINPLIYSGDNGRVLGYDNAHGEHHRHCMGEVEAVDLPGYEAALRRFQAEWQAIARRLKAERSRARRGRKDE